MHKCQKTIEIYGTRNEKERPFTRYPCRHIKAVSLTMDLRCTGETTVTGWPKIQPTPEGPGRWRRLILRRLNGFRWHLGRWVPCHLFREETGAEPRSRTFTLTMIGTYIDTRWYLLIPCTRNSSTRLGSSVVQSYILAINLQDKISGEKHNNERSTVIFLSSFYTVKNWGCDDK